MGFDSVRTAKIMRLGLGIRPRALDLFSGCGGLSIGFQRAGFEIVGAVDTDPFAALSHAFNFHRGTDHELHHSQARDMTELDPVSLISELGLMGPAEAAIDVLIGGPPCQAFARVGRAKLREVDAHPDAFRLDPRGNLYLRYLHYVRVLKPVAILVENVPDVMNYGGHNIAEEMCEILEEEGYDCAYTLLNAAYYGVPQMRERMFLIAFAKELNAIVKFPKPTHWVDLPRGYESSRQVALKSVSFSMFDLQQFYVEPPRSHPELTPATTARQAIQDLPPFTLHLENGMRRGARQVDEYVPYHKDVAPSIYGIWMRNWPGFETVNGSVTGHVIRFLPRDYKIFARMEPGDQYPEAHRLAWRMLAEKLEQCRQEGCPVDINSPDYERLKIEFVPQYDPGKFPNKWRKMEPDRPCRTLMAHLGKDGYSHIHYDSGQARTISVREAARLQSFPDGFIFKGTMNPAFRQVGNGVPPLLSFTIAEEMMRTITDGLRSGTENLEIGQSTSRGGVK